MPRTLFAILLLLLPALLAGLAASKSGHIRLRRPIAVHLADQGKRLLVANRDSGTLAIVDAVRLRVLSETRIGRKLSDMAVSAQGGLVLATDEETAELSVFAYRDGAVQELRRIKVGLSPVSVQISDDARLATVACQWPRRLLLVSLEEPYSQRSIDVPFAPRRQLLFPGTTKLLVADSFGGKLALIDIARGTLESVRSTHVHNIRDLRLDRDGKTVLMTHQVLYSQGQPNGGDIRSGNLISNQVRRLSLASVLSPTADILRDEVVYTLGDIEKGAGDPAEVAETADGAIVVTFAGVNEVAIGRPEHAIWTRLDIGARPSALAIDDTFGRAYVANTFSDSIAVVDLAKAKVIANIDLGTKDELAAAERGEMLFYDARLSLDGWFSCHSCHSDGHTNGRLNDNFTDGSFGTPKRVLSLLGARDSAPWAWNGKMTDLEDQVRNSIKSTMQGGQPKPQQVSDLVAYLHTLSPPPALAAARNAVDAAAVERGRHVFTERQCAVCHAPETYTSPRSYDVGLRDQAGETQFNPPSLRGVSQAGPYFHDNRAATLDEVMTRFRHRLPELLADEELRDLLHFLHSR